MRKASPGVLRDLSIKRGYTMDLDLPSAQVRGFDIQVELGGNPHILLLRAFVQLTPDAPAWGIQPVSEINVTAAKTSHAVFNSSDNQARGSRCANKYTVKVDPPSSPSPPGGAFLECEIAIDSDDDMYTKNKSDIVATQNDILAVMNGVDTATTGARITAKARAATSCARRTDAAATNHQP